MRNNFVEGGLFFHFMTADVADRQAPVPGDAAHAGSGAISPPLLVLLWAMACRRRSTCSRLPGTAA